jgi:hypothetical protein
MSTQTLARRKFAIYSDEVFTSTDLNRRSGEVLNHARKNPVTISRNNEQFALMRREDAACLVSTLDKLKEVLDLFQAVISVAVGMPMAPTYSWVKALSNSDRLTMAKEVLTECSKASTSEDWDALADMIYEWKETALVAESGIIQEVLGQPSEEVPLTVPVLEEEDHSSDERKWVER